MNGTAVVLAALVAERERQERLKKEGKFTHTCADREMNNHQRLTVLVEEVGEVARALNDLFGLSPKSTVGIAAIEHLKTELVQCAACCVAWLESDCL